MPYRDELLATRSSKEEAVAATRPVGRPCMIQPLTTQWRLRLFKRLLGGLQRQRVRLLALPRRAWQQGRLSLAGVLLLGMSGGPAVLPAMATASPPSQSNIVVTTPALAVTSAGNGSTIEHTSGAASVEEGIEVRWATVSEETTEGFNIYRSESPDELSEAINTELIPGQNGVLPQGASYTLLDDEVVSGVQYSYTLVVWDVDGTSELNGPTMGTYGSPTALTLTGFESGSAMPSLVGAALALLLAALGWVWQRVEQGLRD